jgi:hypothetical protein
MKTNRCRVGGRDVEFELAGSLLPRRWGCQSSWTRSLIYYGRSDGGNGVALEEFGGSSRWCLRVWSVLVRRLLDNDGEVATAAVLHENIENPSVSVDVSAVVSCNVAVMRMFLHIRCCQSVVRLQALTRTHTSATICFLSRSPILSKSSSLRVNICEP